MRRSVLAEPGARGAACSRRSVLAEQRGRVAKCSRSRTLAEQREARYYPALQTWALMQEEERPQLTLAADELESAHEARARRALCLLMDCPIPDILVRTLRFLYD